MNPEEHVLSALSKRYATKRFDPTKKISETLIGHLEDSLVATPSSYGLQPWNFLVISDLETRKKLKPATWNQPQVDECSHFVVFATKTTMDEAYVNKYVARIAEIRGVPKEQLEGFRKMMVGSITGPLKDKIHEWTSRQAYIALGQLLLSAAILGIDACPMEGFVPEKYDEILGLKAKGFGSVVCCALGYRSDQDDLANAKKVRFHRDEIISRI